MSSPEVTQWPERILLTIFVLAVILLAVYGMWRGWRNRANRDDFPPLATPPEISDPDMSIDGKYLATVIDGQWLNRVVAQGLGAPGHARILTDAEGILIERQGEVPLYIPRSSVVSVDLGRGIAGEVYEKNGMCVITWTWGDTQLATGFRATHISEQMEFLDMMHGQKGTR